MGYSFADRSVSCHIIRDYLRFFEATSPAVGNMPEYEGIPADEAGKLWRAKVLSVAAEFDTYLSLGERRGDYSGMGLEPYGEDFSEEEWRKVEAERRACLCRGFDTLKEIFTELQW